MLSVEIILLVTATFLLGGFVKGTIGLGLPVVALAMMAAPLGVEKAMAIMLVPCFVTNVWQALAGPYFAQLLKRLWTYLLAALAGTWIGVSVLAEGGDGMLMVLGVVLCAYSAIYFAGFRAPAPGEREPIAAPVAGGLGGVMFGMTGTFIIPGILYLQALGLKRDALVQALGLVFVTITTGLTASFLHHQLIPAQAAALSGYALLPAAVGLVLGRRYRQAISEELFTRYFFAALFATGLYMIVRSTM